MSAANHIFKQFLCLLYDLKRLFSDLCILSEIKRKDDLCKYLLCWEEPKVVGGGDLAGSPRLISLSNLLLATFFSFFFYLCRNSGCCEEIGANE